ncbi:hypothetical protein C7S18_07235 [Ahniella affigens]|uniref:protein O-GlcNAc transferase n=1 Tax=Ahniella affigens TaxID=2021234 RepID=A0A2P1PQ83_9GAMM|nr:hypothetical protein [Ahniella affigens]AVP97001.1 hypothetical protein C7S18_07235 [Ahniella affigens]
MDLMQAFEHAALNVARWELDQAEQRLRQIVAEAPHAAPRAHAELAIALSLQGRGPDALAEIEKAVALAPHDATILQNQLILEKLREPEAPARFLDLHRAFGARFTPAGGCLAEARAIDPNKKLKTAYLGVDAHTALKRFMPILAEHHDRSRFDLVFCHGLADLPALEAARARWPHVHHVATRDISARHYARALAHLGIDIAVDLSGHGLGGTLQALAYRPALLQVTWLDYVAGTGVPAIDFRVADAVTDPDDNRSTEPVLRLPFAQWCAVPPPEPADQPQADDQRPPTLGLINVTVKLSARLLNWAARILERVPEARLLVLGLTGQQARAHALSLLPEALHARIDLFDRVDEATYHELVATVDLCLDPPVFSGATSTLDALAAGIPVLSCPGHLPHTRSSASILETLNLQPWIAATDDALIDQAVQMLEHVELMRGRRHSLREQVLASSLHQGPTFVAALEQLLAEAWSSKAQHHQARSAAQWVQAVNAAIQAQSPQQAIYALEGLTLYQAPDGLLRRLAIAYNQLGVQWLKHGARFEAARHFEMALEIDPQQADAAHNLQQCR